jgi:hypothetical protein
VLERLVESVSKASRPKKSDASGNSPVLIHGPEEIHAALLELRKSGATVDAIRQQPVLIHLVHIRAGLEAGDASDAELAALCRPAIDRAARALGTADTEVIARYPNEGRAARLLLGLLSGGHPQHRRREWAASELEMEVETMLHRRPGIPSHEERVIHQVADVMWEHETGARLGNVLQRLADLAPRAGIELVGKLLGRYEHYYRVWTALGGLRADVTAALNLRATGDDEINALDDYVGSSLYWYAKYHWLVTRFIDDFGGMWILTDPDREEAIAAAIKVVEHFSPLSYRDESRLDQVLDRSADLDPFLSQLERRKYGARILEHWRRRVLSCNCSSTIDSRCRVHAMMRACETYTDLLDQEWYEVAPWYGRVPTQHGIVDAATLYRDLGLPVRSEASNRVP